MALYVCVLLLFMKNISVHKAGDGERESKKWNVIGKH